jgi:hypothetical protein
MEREVGAGFGGGLGHFAGRVTDIMKKWDRESNF